MSVNRKYIESIIAANNDNSLAIIVGAGISKSSETKTLKLPTWKDLIDSLKADLNTPNETDYLKIAQLYHLAFGKYTYYRKLKNFFPDNIPPSKIHKQIFEINPHVVITTNWDNILEKAVEENAYIYDLVCSDIDLVKSTIQNKLIKMHGDFKNHNLVFKEDDYINYQFNFPLIENYIKSIISTHTVLFLGYSYSDLDLKQIVKWIQNHALDVRPPMYLVTYERNSNQMKYLENHGITTIVIEDIDDDIKSDIDLDLYSKKMYSFLASIRNNNQNDILNNSTQVAKFVLGKLEPLNQLNGILMEQVQKVLSNCGFLYDVDSRPILEFYQDRQTLDSDKTLRAIYSTFAKQLRLIDEGGKPTVEVLKVFDILSKARIKGIVLLNDDVKNHNQEYIPIANYIAVEDDNGVPDLYNFNYEGKNNNEMQLNGTFDLVFKYYNQGKQEEAFALLEDIIAVCLKRRSYIWLFLAMYNRNVIFENLKFYSYKREISKKYDKYKKYDLKERYHNLTKDVRTALQPVYEFIDFTFIYRYAYDVSKDLRSTEDAKNTVETGGFVFHNDVFKYSTRHENLVSFVLKNRILIEDYEEYKSINKGFVKIALIRQTLNKNVVFTKTELYSCIRYIKHKELQELFGVFYADEFEHKCKLDISPDLKEWLINIVLHNVAEQYLQDGDEFRRFEFYLENIIFILGLVKHEEDHLDNIIQQIGRIVKEGRNTINLFQCINLFFAIQHTLFKQEIKDNLLTDLIETIISKLIYGKLNGHEFFAITRNDLSNVYGYAQIQKVIINNEALIDKLLSRVNELSNDDKIDITQSLLFSLYDISIQPIKDKIKVFALSIDTVVEDAEEQYKRLVFELTLIIRGFKELSDELVTNLNKYLERYKSGTAFSSVLYRLDSQLDYLIKEKSLENLGSISITIKDCIKRHKERDVMAFF